MKPILFSHPNIEVRTSIIHGYGIFATKDIKAGEIIEECSFLPMEGSFTNLDKTLKRYVFCYPKGKPGVPAALLGRGVYFNHSNSNNTDWKTDEENQIFIFFAINDIRAGEELFINYGPGYWEHIN
jgi:SET domain-containing protein